MDQHLAEKLHAYTLPRTQENTRIKDLVDLVIIAACERVEADRLEPSARATFDIRATHAVPFHLPMPPDSWANSFSALTSEAQIAPTTNLNDGHAFAARFWDPFLSGSVVHQKWNPATETWM